jgi:hypothetical protein
MRAFFFSALLIQTSRTTDNVVRQAEEAFSGQIISRVVHTPYTEKRTSWFHRSWFSLFHGRVGLLLAGLARFFE